MPPIDPIRQALETRLDMQKQATEEKTALQEVIYQALKELVIEEQKQDHEFSLIQEDAVYRHLRAKQNITLRRKQEEALTALVDQGRIFRLYVGDNYRTGYHGLWILPKPDEYATAVDAMKSFVFIITEKEKISEVKMVITTIASYLKIPVAVLQEFLVPLIELELPVVFPEHLRMESDGVYIFLNAEVDSSKFIAKAEQIVNDIMTPLREVYSVEDIERLKARLSELSILLDIDQYLEKSQSLPFASNKNGFVFLNKIFNVIRKIKIQVAREAQRKEALDSPSWPI